MRNTITPYLWHLWASNERNSGVTKTGFYSVQPFAKQYRSSHVWDSERNEPPTDAETLVSQEIARAVSRLRESKPDQAQAVTLFHGAYPNAPANRKDRLKSLDVPKRKFYDAKERAEIYVQAWVDRMEESACKVSADRI